MEKTLAMRVLEGKRIHYEPVAYDAGERDAARIAELFGVPAGQVLKTLVVAPGHGKAMLVMVPADRRLDLKKLAAAVGEKKLKLASHREAEALTGLEVGGISPLALLNRGFRILLDAAAPASESVFVSAGRKGLNLRLRLADLEAVTGARRVDASGPAEDPPSSDFA